MPGDQAHSAVIVWDGLAIANITGEAVQQLTKTSLGSTAASAANARVAVADVMLSTERTATTHTVPRPILICFSHLRWNFVYQRPQHLMTRFARSHQVIYFEEPEFVDAADVGLAVRTEPNGVQVVVPRVEAGQAEQQQHALLDQLLLALGQTPAMLWYYTPMSLGFSEHVRAARVIYDCMDELSAFRFCPPDLVDRERRLISRADVLFTGGHSLYEAKRSQHANAHACPSSVDVAHFRRARSAAVPLPTDMRYIEGPRLGFYGVLDERFDVDLLTELALRRPDWQFVLLGPIVKIDRSSLPALHNVHLLGAKRYEQLPDYLAHWDVALMPFAMNESTRFISPTKTPEYLAGGCPVVSTPIRDVVRSYGDCPAVRIASNAVEFEAAIAGLLSVRSNRSRHWIAADAYLRDLSWDATWQRMAQELRRLDI